MASSKRNEIRAAIQQRVKRFSAFELLGLDADQTANPALASDQEFASPEFSLEIGAKLDTPYRSDISDGLTHPQTVPSDAPSDGLTHPQTVPSDVPSDLHISDPLIEGGSDSTIPQLEPRIETVLPSPVISDPVRAVPLAPLQWRVWQALLKSADKVVSYQGLAAQVNGSIPGIRQAIRIIEKEGGILSRMTVREKTAEGAILQGFRVVLNQAVGFHPISSQEAHKIQQRQINLHDISDHPTQRRSDISDRLRMYVSNKLHTYMPELLRLCPPDWQIREQTLAKIIEAFPEISALEFRRSIRYLVEQSKTAKQPIQNPNAWLKAAFERNGGPLVTERMIEVQIDQRSSALNAERTFTKTETDPDFEILRRYVSASMEDKIAIDSMAEERVGRLLETVSPDKHHGIREQARIDCAREFFAAQEKK